MRRPSSKPRAWQRAGVGADTHFLLGGDAHGRVLQVGQTNTAAGQ
jgi:hypothetical protein